MRLITIIAACVALCLAAVMVFRVNARPKKILKATISALDHDILTKRFESARKRFSSQSIAFADSVNQSSWARYCRSLGGFTPEFQDAYAMTSTGGDTLIGAFKRKSINDLEYHYFLDIILIKEKGKWKILQLRLPKMLAMQ